MLPKRTAARVDRVAWESGSRSAARSSKGMAVACPFCVTMFEDGVRALNVEERFAVRDIAEIVSDALG